MRRALNISALSLCLSASSLGCSDDGLAVLWEGEHVVFAAERPEQVCVGTREYLDRRAGEMLDRLGSDPLRIEYFLMDDVSEYCTLGSVVSGCAEAGVVYSESVPHLHEIVHARSGDHLPLVLEEGLATYLGDPYPIEKMAPRERLVELLTDSPNGIDTVADYGRAAHFVAFISETFGRQSLLELDLELARDSTPQQLDSAFQTVLGLDVDAVLDAYAEYPECMGIIDNGIACSEPAVLPGFPSTTHERLVDCTSSDGVGPHHSGMVFVEDVMELPPAIDTTRTVSITGDGAKKGGFVLLRRCGPCPENGVGTIKAGPTFIPEEQLPAGRYLVRFYLPIEESPAVVGVRIDG